MTGVALYMHIKTDFVNLWIQKLSVFKILFVIMNRDHLHAEIIAKSWTEWTIINSLPHEYVYAIGAYTVRAN